MSYSVPYAQPVTVTDGMEITIVGEVKHDAHKITCGLTKGRDINQEVPVIIDFRFGDQIVVRNHRDASNWGSEERQGGFPLKKGETSEVKFTLKGNDIQVFVNKAHFCDFKLRIPKEVARYVFIDGGIHIHNVQISGGHSSHEQHNPPVPVTIPVSNIRAGHKFHFRGTPTGANRFSIYFLCGPDDKHDVCLVIDSRFNFGSHHNVVIFNHKSGGNWGTEEKGHQFPFSANSEFELVVKVKEDSCKVIVDDEKIGNFHFHITPERITHVNVQGDVRLSHIKV